jgi:phosphoserine phosphatase RsbU/P
MANLFVRAESAILRRLRQPPLTGIAEHVAFWSLAAVLILALVALLPGEAGDLYTIAMFLALSVLIISAAVLAYRWLVSHVLWKVRNRLIVTYLLMGLTPLVLFVTLAGVAGYLFAGQFATFAATSEMDAALNRLAAANQAFAVHAAHALAAKPHQRSLDLTDYEGAVQSTPGHLTIDAWSDGQPVRLSFDGRLIPFHNVDGRMAYPAWPHDGFRSVVLDGGYLYLRAVNSRAVNGTQVTMVSSAMLDPQTVGQLAQGLGVIHILPDLGRALNDDGARRSRVNPRSEKEIPMEAITAVSGGTLESPAFLLDRRITFSAPLNIADWRNGKPLTGLINVTSRPALLYARLFGAAVVVATLIRYALITLATIFAVLELIAFVMAVRLNRTITRAVADLYKATTAIDRGDFAHRIRVQRHDQLGALSTSFNTMSESLERLLEQQREKERMQSELEIAQEVQNNLFPHGQLQVPGLELHGVCKPARTVSGDYYDFLLMDGDELCVAMGDISGKGISAALLMASLHSAVRAYGFANDGCADGHGHTGKAGVAAPLTVAFSSPGKVLSLLNHHLYRGTQAEKYATLFLAHYNTHTRRLVYSNGGQLPPLVLCASGAIRRLDCGGSVVGLLDNQSYEEGAVTLDPGDILVAYSDGVTEPENEFGEFGEDRLIETVQRHRHLPLAAISQQVMQSLRAWIGDQEQPDDITLVLARQAAAD